MTSKNNKSDNGNQFSSWVTVSHRGQIAIPIGIRKQLKINEGDRLLIVIRKDKDGLNLIKSETLEIVFNKYGR